MFSLKASTKSCISYKDLNFNPLLIVECSNVITITKVRSCYSSDDLESLYEKNILSALYYKQVNRDSSKVFLDSAINLCKNNSITGDKLAFSYYLISDYYQQSDQFDLAIQYIDEAKSIATSKELVAASIVSKICLLGRDEINNKFNSLTDYTSKKKLDLDSWYSILYYIGMSSGYYRNEFYPVLDKIDKIENTYLKIVFLTESSYRKLKTLPQHKIKEYERLLNRLYEDYGNHNDRINALLIKYGVSTKIACHEYNSAFKLAKKLLTHYSLNPNDLSTISSKKLDKYGIDAVRVYARSLLYLTRTNRGLAPVHEAYNIYLELIRYFNKEPSNFNNSHYLLSINYYGLDNILVIASYLSKQTGDISYLTRAHSALDALKSRDVRIDRYANDQIRAGGELGKLLRENKTLKRELFLKENYAWTHPEEDLFDELVDLHQQKTSIGARITEALEGSAPIFEQEDVEHTIAHIQKNILTDSSCLLLFHAGDHHQSLLVTKDTVLYQNLLAKLPTLDDYLDFRTLLSRKNTTDSLAKKSHQVSEALFATYRPFLKKRLFIVANGPFETFPFGALRTDTMGDVPRYFADDHTLSYHYSLRTFLDDQNTPKATNTSKEAILALAPSFKTAVQYASDYRNSETEYLHLPPLLYNKQELISLKEQFAGKFYDDRSANKQVFLENANQYKIIHLATHALANSRLGSQSAFFLSAAPNAEEHIVTCQAGEVAELNLDADLVVLSACETSLGSRLSSEGTVGLTRAFSSAGADAILSSLWSVDDQTTAEIVIDFYKQLSQGASKSTALSRAQRNYRERYANTIKAHPYYWASFVLVGNDQNIDWLSKGSSNRPYYLLLVTGFVGLILFYISKRK